MNKTLVAVFCCSLIILGAGCNKNNTENSAADTSQQYGDILDQILDDGDTTVYTSTSWETEISESCQTFFDGCQICNRTKDDGIVCIEDTCETYEKPACLNN